MTARLVAPAPATHAEWQAARDAGIAAAGITASEIPVVMGLSPYGSPFELYHRKLGNLPPLEDNDAMERGRVLEPYVAAKFRDSHPEVYVDGNGMDLFAHPDRPWQMATPDRLLCVDECRCGATEDVVCTCIRGDELVAVLEIKTAASYDGWGEEGTDEIPVHYRCQVLWQMDVMGVQAAYVACLFVQSWKVRVYELTMDEDARHDLALMRIEAELFLARIEDHHAPDVDWRPATTSALKHLHPSVEDTEVAISGQLADRYRSACARLKAAEQKKAGYENRIRALIGTGRRAVVNLGNGATEPVAARQVYDVAAKTIERKAFTVDKLVPARPSKEHQE